MFNVETSSFAHLQISPVGNLWFVKNLVDPVSERDNNGQSSFTVSGAREKNKKRAYKTQEISFYIKNRLLKVF